MNPTPEQLTRAAELAPRVLKSIGVDRVTRSNNHLSNLLDPRAFQAVVLALPTSRLIAAVGDCRPGDEALLLRHTLTPAGMLAFYEALVAQKDAEDA